MILPVTCIVVACVAGVKGEGKGCKKGEGEKGRTPAIRTGIFTLRPPISWLNQILSTVNAFTNQKLNLHALLHMADLMQEFTMFTTQHELANWNFSSTGSTEMNKRGS